MNLKKVWLLRLTIFTIFVDALGFGIVLPVVPNIFTNPDSVFYIFPPDFIEREAYILFGLLVAIFPFAQFLTAPILGQLSDRFGRKNILSYTLLGTAAAYVIFAAGLLTKNLYLLFASRALGGVAGGNISVAQAVVADISSAENRTKNFGLMGAAYGLGFILGPYIGGKLSDASLVSWFSVDTPFWFAAILSFLNFLSITLFFKDTNEKFLNLKIHLNNAFLHIVKAYRMLELRPLFITTFLFFAGFTFFTTFFGVFLIDRFDYNEGSIGDLFAYIGFCMVLVQILIVPRVASLLSEAKVLQLSLALSGAAVSVFLFLSEEISLIWAVPLFVVFVGLSQVNMTSLISKLTHPDMQGEVLGITASVNALAQSIPPVLSGFIAARIAPTAPILVAALVMVMAGIVFTLSNKAK